MFFSFDGIDGSGKSTQMRLFCDWLREQGHTVVTCRDPGGTPLGEQIRGLLLNHDETIRVGLHAEMLLYMAARAQLVEEVIRPALERGETVVSDRFVAANIVYQGHAGGIDVESVRAVGGVATQGISPDCTFILDMSAEKAIARIGREQDRIESRGAEYRSKVREGFLAEAEQSPSVHVIDADRPVQDVQEELRSLASRLLEADYSPDSPGC